MMEGGDEDDSEITTWKIPEHYGAYVQAGGREKEQRGRIRGEISQFLLLLCLFHIRGQFKIINSQN